MYLLVHFNVQILQKIFRADPENSSWPHSLIKFLKKSMDWIQSYEEPSFWD